MTGPEAGIPYNTLMTNGRTEPSGVAPRGGPGPNPLVCGRRQGQGGCARWGTTGCLAGVIVLAAVVVASFFFLDTGVDWAVKRARVRLEERLPADLTMPERQQFDADLDAFFARLRARSGSAPLAGAFLERVGTVLDDGKVTRVELMALEGFLRQHSSPGPTRSGG